MTKPNSLSPATTFFPPSALAQPQPHHHGQSAVPVPSIPRSPLSPQSSRQSPNNSSQPSSVINSPSTPSPISSTKSNASKSPAPNPSPRNSSSNYILSLIRLSLAYLLLWIGFNYVFHPGDSIIVQNLPQDNQAYLTYLKLAGTLFLTFTSMLTVGLFTRLASLIAALFLISSTLIAGIHESSLIYLVCIFICLMLAITQPDQLTLDHLLYHSDE